MHTKNTIKEVQHLKYYTGLHSEIREHFRKGNRPTEFGNKVWSTSLVLIDYFESNACDLHNKRVLEIGCGQGILGIYLAKKYNCKVTCSDFDKTVLPIVEMHASLNNLEVDTKQLSFEQIDSNILRNYDIVIGAEVCYSDEVGKEIISLTDRALSSGVQKVFIGDPGRPDFEDFLNLCSQSYKTSLNKLPKSKNGKVTNLLTVSKITS